MKYTLLLFYILFISCNASHIAAQNSPKSTQAVFVETYSPAEVTIKAWGVGEDVENAEVDAKKEAIYFVLTTMSDPLLQTLEEKSAFEAMKENFFQKGNYERFISFFGTDILNRVKIKDGVRV